MASQRFITAVRIRRGVQTASMLAFLYLLWNTAFPLASSLVPMDFFLRLDPLVAVTVPLAARQWIALLLPGFFCLIITVFMGRIFCGWICPMGTTLDAARLVTGKKRHKATPLLPSTMRNMRFGLLAGCLAAALLGINLAHWFSPIPLVTRFYAFVLHPLAAWIGNNGASLARPIAETLGSNALAYITIPVRAYSTSAAVATFFLILFCLERVRPRFWCRYLCPAGAVLSLISSRAVWKRQVSRCSGCGLCAQQCPTNALTPKGNIQSHANCITCQKCVEICPVNGVTFTSGNASSLPRAHTQETPALPSRRVLLAGIACGTTLAVMENSGAYPALAGERSLCIRPPGARPEREFLSRCLRCGQCMKGCPTNALQPAWLTAGIEGMFTPVLIPRCGACEPECSVCGNVCPTGAIHALPLEEKIHAKIGTAVVLKETCLAWAEGRQCVVCEEVCPYGAIAVIRTEAGVSGPVVDAPHCFGCGFCEQFCPIEKPAIIIAPTGALRLSAPRFPQAAQEAGISIIPANRQKNRPQTQQEIAPDELPPGFTD